MNVIEIKNVIEKLRLTARLSITEMARELNVSKQCLSTYLKRNKLKIVPSNKNEFFLILKDDNIKDKK